MELNSAIQWVLPIAIFILTFAAVRAARLLLKRIGDRAKVRILEVLAPSLSNLIYVAGAGLFLENIPLSERTYRLLSNGLYVFGVFVVMSIVHKAAVHAIEWGQLRTRGAATLNVGFVPLLRNLITLFVFMMGAIMILKHFGYDVMSLITALGVGSLAVGLAAKDTLSHMISGFTLIIDRNLLPGDRINLGGSVGEVQEIGLRSTRINTGNGNTLIVPNSELVNTKLLNLSAPSRAVALNASIRLPYSAPFEKVRAVALKATENLGHLDRNRDRTVALLDLSEGFQKVTTSFWVTDVSYESQALSEFNAKLLAGLAEAGISV